MSTVERRTGRRHVPFTCSTCGRPMAKVEETREWQGAIRRKRKCAEGHAIWTRETVTA